MIIIHFIDASNWGYRASRIKGLPGFVADWKSTEASRHHEGKPEEVGATTSNTGWKGKKKRGPSAVNKLPTVFPTSRCKLKLLKMERIKDHLLLEEEFVINQERLKPKEEKAERERSEVDDLRGSPMGVGTLEEIIDDDHAIVSSATGPEYYVNISRLWTRIY
ncbi:hypothetical protein KEM48_007528 [Puccinia striiformis f. sp. tritici PST-130]|nr:hypothetical protein KEM48_007528 [Puccinia striiformis f. sp. tritici PST-130]